MKKYFIAGILVWAPMAVTIWVITWGLGLLDGVFGSVMQAIIEGETLAKINEKEAILVLQKDLENVKLDEYRRHCLEVDLGSLLKLLKD